MREKLNIIKYTRNGFVICLTIIRILAENDFNSETCHDRNERVEDSGRMFYTGKDIAIHLYAVKTVADRHSFIERCVTSQAERCRARKRFSLPLPADAILSSAVQPRRIPSRKVEIPWLRCWRKRRGMRSRRHLTRQSVGHLWHFIKCRLAALGAARERQRVDADGNNKNGKGRRHSREQCAQQDAADGNNWEKKSGRETRRPVFMAQSGFIMWWSRGICRICIAVAVAAIHEEDASISPRPRMPQRTFNIGNGPRIAADCESAVVSGQRNYTSLLRRLIFVLLMIIW